MITAPRSERGAVFFALRHRTQGKWMMSSLTLATPAFTMSRSLAAAFDRSMTRPATCGPRSLMRTTVDAPVSNRVTRTSVPN